MIITNNVRVPLNAKTQKYYLDLGYTITDGFFDIDIIHLTKSSRVEVETICDYCLNIKRTTYKDYNRNTSFNGKFSCSNKCASLKKKEISYDKYGVDSPSKLDSVKLKSRKSVLDKYGSEFYMSTDDFKVKSKKTKIDKYGTSNLMSLDIIKDKCKETNLLRYGVENIFQSEEVKSKIKIDNLSKYGFEFYQSTDEFKLKFKKTNLDKYGVDHPMKFAEIFDKFKKTSIDKYGGYYLSTDEFKSESKKTNLSRYGVEIPMKSKFIQNKVRLTNLEKFGVEYPMMSDVIKKKSKESVMKKYGSNHILQSDEIRSKFFNNCKKNYIKYLSDKCSLYRCDLGHDFSINSSNYIHRKINNITICTVCNPIGTRSDRESQIFNFISNLYSGKIVQNYRDVLEIDIFLPDLKIGFELNGLYWHSEIFRDKNYHLDKSLFFKERGIRIIHIWEDDWVFKRSILESQIRNIIGMSLKIYARNCEVNELDVNLAKKFLNDNHIQGFSPSDIYIGIMYNMKLVGIMCFNRQEGRKRMIDNDWCLSRYCNVLDTTIVGGPSKCFSFFVKKYYPNRIISYSDNSWSYGNMYKLLGFNKIGETKPDYKYIFKNRRVNKSRFRKSEIIRKFDLSTLDISESNFLRDKNIFKIFDCGKTKFEWITIN